MNKLLAHFGEIASILGLFFCGVEIHNFGIWTFPLALIMWVLYCTFDYAKSPEFYQYLDDISKVKNDDISKVKKNE